MMNWMKKLAAGGACVLMLGLLAVPASAHGNHNHSGHGGYGACTVQGCTESGNHCHNGVTYCGHSGSTGHHRGHC